MPIGKITNQPMHIHPVLTLIENGKQVKVPSQIGISASKWKDHEFDSFIGDMGCAPIHTHDSSGVMHVESSVTTQWTLGDFMKIWGKSPLSLRTYFCSQKVS